MIFPAQGVEDRQTTTTISNSGTQQFAEAMYDASAAPTLPHPGILPPPGILHYFSNTHVNYVNGDGYQVQEDLGPVGSLGPKYQTPQEVMQYFQNHPQQIFPFGLSGAASIKPGETIHLQTPLPWSNSPVQVVNVGRTSFTFKTLPGHFDPPGSTITFTVYESGGHMYLEQTASWKFAPGAAGVTQRAEAYASVAPAIATWTQQGNNLRKVVQS
jgi:hypothetical protein